MDNYDSTYPLEYYSVGKKYLFYRDITNKNFWLPANNEEQRIYDTYVAKYLPELNVPAEKQTRKKADSVGVTEAQDNTSVGVTEVNSGVKGVTEDQKQEANQGNTKLLTPKDGEGALVDFKNINKEIGIVVAKYDSCQDAGYTGKDYQAITVLFDDGQVVDYILGQSSYFNQKNYAVQQPKRASTVDTAMRTKMKPPRGLLAMVDTAIISSTPQKQKSGVTESNPAASRKGITESVSIENPKGVTEIHQ